MNKTNVVLILDKSGSMANTKDKTINYFKEQVQQTKIMAQDQEIRFSLITFNGNVFETCWNQQISEISEDISNEYQPGGSTALYEALGYALDKTVENSKEEPDLEFLFIIITDGENTDFKKYSQEYVSQKIAECKKTNKWHFVYLGCSEKNVNEVSKKLHIDTSNTAFWDSSDLLSAKKAYAGTVKGTKLFFERRCNAGELQVMNFYSSDEKPADFANIKKDDETTEWTNANIDLTSKGEKND